MIRLFPTGYNSFWWYMFRSRHAIATDPITADYSKSVQRAFAEASGNSIVEDAVFPYLVPAVCPAKARRLNSHDSSWVIDFGSMPLWYSYNKNHGRELSIKEWETRRDASSL